MIGSGLRGDIKRRCEWLEALLQICVKMQNEISFRAPPIIELLEKCSGDSPCAPLFSEAKENIAKGFPCAWRESAQKWAKSAGLTREETATVLLLDSLGSNDIEGEKRLLSGVCERISSQAENARNELLTKGKMLFSCSMLAGLAIVILII